MSVALRQVQRALVFFMPQRPRTVILGLSLLLGSAIGVAPPLLTGAIIDALTLHQLHRMLWVLVLLFSFSLASGLLNLFQSNLVTTLRENVGRDIRVKLVRALHRAHMSFFASTSTGEITNRINGDVESILASLQNFFVPTFSAIITLIATLIAMFTKNWLLTLVAAAVLPISLLPLMRIRKQVTSMRRSINLARDNLESTAQDTMCFPGIALVKVSNVYDSEATHFSEAAESLVDLNIRANMVARWFSFYSSAANALGPVLILAIGGWAVTQGMLSVGAIVALLGLQARLYPAAGVLLQIPLQWAAAENLFQRVFEILDLMPEAGGGEKPAGLDIDFSRVSFAYGSRVVLRDVTVSIPHGQTVAIVGPSGAGKTTLALLLLRYYDVSEGEIRLGGIPICDMNLDALRRTIAIASQEAYLFTRTAAENLQLSRSATPKLDLPRITRLCEASEIIDGWPAGLDTVIGLRNGRLSGGERQRLALTRTLLREAPVVILDEATSALDYDGESRIRLGIEELPEKRTLIIITHRLTTITRADQIIVMDKGCVVESGDHSTLLANKGLYFKLFQRNLENEGPRTNR